MRRDERTQVSGDELTGIELPGLSANSLAVEPWWGERELTTWLARRLYDYRHLREIRGPGTRPWVVAGVETGRGPDNEPLVTQCTAVAEIALSVIDEAAAEVERFAANWGSLRRADPYSVACCSFAYAYCRKSDPATAVKIDIAVRVAAGAKTSPDGESGRHPLGQTHRAGQQFADGVLDSVV